MYSDKKNTLQELFWIESEYMYLALLITELAMKSLGNEIPLQLIVSHAWKLGERQQFWNLHCSW